jgi:hypothetical protein
MAGGKQLESDEIRNLIEIKDRHASEIKSLQNVTGLGVGMKKKGGKLTEQKCIIVFVDKKIPKVEIAESEMVPEKLEEVVTDVVETHFKIYFNHQARHNPAVGGISISRSGEISAGTFGITALDDISLNDVMLSNWHVMAGNNPNEGDEIIQPGGLDSGTTNDIVGELDRWLIANEFDLAIAQLTTHRDHIYSNVAEIGNCIGIAHPVMSETVRKSGRTTGLTQGTVIGIDVDDTVDYGDLGGNRTVEHQILVDGHSLPGDSGSAVINSQNEVIGVLFAGDSNIYLANNIMAVNEEFRITPGYSTIDLIANGKILNL